MESVITLVPVASDDRPVKVTPANYCNEFEIVCGPYLMRLSRKEARALVSGLLDYLL